MITDDYCEVLKCVFFVSLFIEEYWPFHRVILIPGHTPEEVKMLTQPTQTNNNEKRWRSTRTLDIYLEITRLYTPLFFQKSTLLRCVTSAFRISSCCYIRICFSLIFLLTWRICFHYGPRMIFVVTTFFHLVRGTQREYSAKPLKHSIVEGIWVFKR